MNKLPIRHGVLPMVALLALVFCVLACVSFSPDDKKILYPAFDPDTGQVCISVYDRQTGQSRPVFVPAVCTNVGTAHFEKGAGYLRPQWMPDSKNILVFWAAPGNKSSDEGLNQLNIAFLPFGMPGVSRFYQLNGEGIGGMAMMYPVCVVNPYLFLQTPSESNQLALIRLNLANGELLRHELKEEVVIIPDPAGKRLLHLGKGNNEAVLKEMNPKTFEPKTLARFELLDLDHPGFTNESCAGEFTLSPDGKSLAVALKHDDESSGANTVRVYRAGKPTLTLPIICPGFGVFCGRLVFSPDGQKLYASMASMTTNQTDHGVCSIGFLEIPLDGKEIRRVPLLNLPEPSNLKEMLYYYFQIGLSHDGKTIAAASTWLNMIDDKSVIDEKDSALFLVDLTDPARKVTKVPVPVPKH